ncbi:hypothetical protein N0V88_005976 [Collariella sp. IMI 366227]|nr:hypothetical protein N0V88_005976 [Collariella sp. IMI 366227]
MGVPTAESAMRKEEATNIATAILAQIQGNKDTSVYSPAMGIDQNIDNNNMESGSGFDAMAFNMNEHHGQAVVESVGTTPTLAEHMSTAHQHVNHPLAAANPAANSAAPAANVDPFTLFKFSAAVENRIRYLMEEIALCQQEDNAYRQQQALKKSKPWYEKEDELLDLLIANGEDIT